MPRLPEALSGNILLSTLALLIGEPVRPREQGSLVPQTAACHRGKEYIWNSWSLKRASMQKPPPSLPISQESCIDPVARKALGEVFSGSWKLPWLVQSRYPARTEGLGGRRDQRLTP